MSGKYLWSNSTRYYIFILTAALFAAAAVSAESSIYEALQACSSIESTADRLACFDALSSEQAISETANSPPDSALDTLGEEMLPDYDREDAQKISVAAHVSSCPRNARKKLMFYFENGHVWKQVDNKRLRYKDCDFDVVISKDGFGYKMQQLGEESKIRISRVR